MDELSRDSNSLAVVLKEAANVAANAASIFTPAEDIMMKIFVLVAKVFKCRVGRYEVQLARQKRKLHR